MDLGYRIEKIVLAVLGDIIEAIVNETSPVGFSQMCDVCLHASMAKNRRPGRTGFSPRALVFGCDERLIASGLNHYLEQLQYNDYQMNFDITAKDLLNSLLNNGWREAD